MLRRKVLLDWFAIIHLPGIHFPLSISLRIVETFGSCLGAKEMLSPYFNFNDNCGHATGDRALTMAHKQLGTLWGIKEHLFVAGTKKLWSSYPIATRRRQAQWRHESEVQSR